MAYGVTPIYIAGRAHSGSTFLDVMLNGARGIKGCGEILEAYQRGPRERCSCGKVVDACPYWSRVNDAYSRRTGRSLRRDAKRLHKLSDIRNFLSALAADVQKPGGKWTWYVEANRAMTAAIGEAFGVKYFIDSNKEYVRALMYLRGDPDARVIHIFRSVHHTVASHYYRAGRGRPIKFMKRLYSTEWFLFPLLMLVALGWSVGMAAAAVLGLIGRGRVLHFSHEAFSVDPQGQLQRLGEFLGVDLSEVWGKVECGGAFPIDHLLAGNEFKHDGTATFEPRTAGRRAAPILYRWGARFMGLPGLIVRALFIRT